MSLLGWDRTPGSLPNLFCKALDMEAVTKVTCPDTVRIIAEDLDITTFGEFKENRTDLLGSSIFVSFDPPLLVADELEEESDA
jgi:hypothetical protein